MGRVEVIRDLLEQDGVEIDAVNEEGETAVFLAAGNNRFEAVKPLVERGADINRADAVGTAALHRISQQCSTS